MSVRPAGLGHGAVGLGLAAALAASLSLQTSRAAWQVADPNAANTFATTSWLAPAAPTSPAATPGDGDGTTTSRTTPTQITGPATVTQMDAGRIHVLALG